MIHFTGKTTYLMDMEKEEKRKFLESVDLENTDFEVKIANYGLSKALKDRETKSLQFCGTLLYMSP